MRPNCCLTILRVSIFVALVLTLDADNGDSDCHVDVKVRRNTVYVAVLGEDLRINCTVEFCNDSPPPVSWYKRETIDVVPVNVSSSSHIKTEWKLLNQSVGRSFLIFQKVRRNDSGVYQCQSGAIVSHNINVSVHDEDSDCDVEVIVPRDTVHEAVLEEDLRINCTVEFCSDSPPPVSWYKCVTTDVNVCSSSHIKTEWKRLNQSVGRSFLIFKKVRRCDSGVYQCQSGTRVSHSINVSVREKLIAVTSKLVADDTFWSTVYRSVALSVFLIIMITLCVASRCIGRCKGESRDTSNQSSVETLPITHIYDNDP